MIDPDRKRELDGLIRYWKTKQLEDALVECRDILKTDFDIQASCDTRNIVQI